MRTLTLVLVFLTLYAIIPISGLRCFYGSSDSSTVTQSQFANPGEVCISYFSCKTPLVNNICTTNGTWYGLGYASNLYKTVFASKYINNLVACATDYCNPLPNSRMMCYTGTSTSLQQSEISSNAAICYTSTDGVRGITSSCNSGYKCCSTNLCNGLGSASNADERYHVFHSIFSVIAFSLLFLLG